MYILDNVFKIEEKITYEYTVLHTARAGLLREREL
jgi:hypothetical protein